MVKYMETENLDLLVNLRRLKSIKRCNNYPVNNIEDVAQHSYYVAVFSYVFAREYNINSSQKVNTELVLLKALFHDLEESYISDIMWNLKHFSNKTEEAIEEATKEILNKYIPGTNYITRSIVNYSNDCKIEVSGKIVAISDLLELLFYCLEEYASGNKYLLTVANRSLKLIKENSFYTELLDKSETFSQTINMCEEILFEENPNILVDKYVEI